MHKNVIDRLRRWGFPHLKLNSQQEQGKKIDEINQVIKSMYEKDRRGEAVVVNTAVAVKKVDNRPTTKSARRRRQKTKKKAEEDNSSDDDSGEERNSDESLFD